MRWRAVLETAATIGVAVVWCVFLRPVALGGPASYIVVHGYSMSGTLAPGDLVITMAQGSYSAGDAIVYRVPSGAGKGLLVVHRILSVDAAGYTMQGDANAFQDPWRPNASDVVGRMVITLPALGRFLSALANPFVLAAVWGLAALLVGMTFLPDPPKPGDPSNPRTTRRRRRGFPDAVGALAPTLVGLMVGLVILSFALILNPALDLMVAVFSVGGGVAAAIVGLLMSVTSPLATIRAKSKPILPNRTHFVHRAPKLTAWALSILTGFVILSACMVMSPAHATGLRVHSESVSTRVHLSSPPIKNVPPSAQPGPGATTPSASPARVNVPRPGGTTPSASPARLKES